MILLKLIAIICLKCWFRQLSNLKQHTMKNYKFTGETSIQTADHETHIFSDEELLVLLKEAIDKKTKYFTF